MPLAQVNSAILTSNELDGAFTRVYVLAMLSRLKNVAVFAFLILCISLRAMAFDVIPGKHKAVIDRVYRDWAVGRKNIRGAGLPMPLQLGAIPTEGDDTYLGIWAKTEIHAGQEDVLKILKDVSNYRYIYPDAKKITVIQDDKNGTVIDWAFGGPFGITTHYETVQSTKKFDPVRGGQIYGLKKIGKVTASDGLTFLQEVEGTSYYVSVDFFNASWGGLAKLFATKIWKETCDSTAKTTFLIKAMSERLKKGQAPKKIELTGANGYDSEKISRICSEMADRKSHKGFDDQISDILAP